MSPVLHGTTRSQPEIDAVKTMPNVNDVISYVSNAAKHYNSSREANA